MCAVCRCDGRAVLAGVTAVRARQFWWMRSDTECTEQLSMKRLLLSVHVTRSHVHLSNYTCTNRLACCPLSLDELVVGGSDCISWTVWLCAVNGRHQWRATCPPQPQLLLLLLLMRWWWLLLIIPLGPVGWAAGVRLASLESDSKESLPGREEAGWSWTVVGIGVTDNYSLDNVCLLKPSDVASARLGWAVSCTCLMHARQSSLQCNWLTLKTSRCINAVCTARVKLCLMIAHSLLFWLYSCQY